MAIRHVAVVAVFALACGRGPAGAPHGSAEAGAVSGTDAGSAPASGGSGSGEGGLPAAADGGSVVADAGPESFADCSGIEPPAPGPAVQIRVGGIDFVHEGCEIGDVDGKGKIGIFCNSAGYRGRTFLADAADAEVSGPFREAANTMAGQASGFIGAYCLGGDCYAVTFGLDDSGQTTFENIGAPARGGRRQVNNPTGGIVRPGFDGFTATIEAFDVSGNISWARTLPEPVDEIVLGVDRAGNVLSLWTAPGPLLPAPRDTKGEWFDPAGNPGPVFVAFSGRQFATRLVERVGSGLFIGGAASSDGGATFTHAWLGQLDAFSTTLAAPPAWLAARPDVSLHMAHGGTAYAVLPPAGAASGTCEQSIEVFSASGHRCGAATFAAGGAACTTGQILVGYDGTVVQELPDRPCVTQFSCAFELQAWKGFFR